MKKLKEVFKQTDVLMHKWTNYFSIYETYFESFRGKNPKFLEIGVQFGGSLKMWDYYFENGEIFGVDINPDCKSLETGNIKIFIGSQNDKIFLGKLASQLKSLDLIVDDGGHTMSQQINTFKLLFPILSEGGIYICEDIESSYQNMYGGGPKRSGTFIEFSKNLIDVINANHSHFFSLKPTPLSKQIEFIHFYNNIVVIKKRTIKEFPHIISNKKIATINNDKRLKVNKLKLFASKVISIINYILGVFRIKPIYIGSTSQRFD
jgi:hypothetical protein